MSKHREDRRQLECVIADLTKELEAKDKLIGDITDIYPDIVQQVDCLRYNNSKTKEDKQQ